MSIKLKKLSIILALGLLSLTAHSKSLVLLDGEQAWVSFNDGDTFKVLEGRLKSARARIVGFNALESYGPVHEWGGNSLAYLYKISQDATDMARAGSWSCKLESGRDTYGRLLVRCDDLALALISAGLAHAYSIDKSPAFSSYLNSQKEAQEKKLGMWKSGVPQKILSSLHSADEGARDTYDRAISTLDGSSELIKHDSIRKTCEKVCIEDGLSCMVFVPFNIRYGQHRPKCLFVSASEA